MMLGCYSRGKVTIGLAETEGYDSREKVTIDRVETAWDGLA